MDSLHRAYLQLQGVWRSLPSGSRRAAALMTFALILGLGYLWTRPVPGPDAELHGVSVTMSRLPAIVSALAKANLKGYQIRGASIFVPRGEESTYLAALAEAQALPLGIDETLRRSMETSNPFESREERDRRNKLTQQDVLAGMIRSMNGIETAYVLYDVDNKAGSFPQEKLITAMVSVKMVGSAQVDKSRVEAIRHLVAGAIAGLRPENVTVCDLSGGRTWYGSVDGGVGAEECVYVSLKQTYERDLKAKILGALNFIPNVTAEASVVLDRQEVTQWNGNHGIDRVAEPHGLASRPNSATTIAGMPGDTHSGKVSVDEQRRATSDAVGPTLVSVRVSVGVPSSYFKKVWWERHPDASSAPDAAALESVSMEEAAKIRRHVAALLPPTQTTSNPAEQITVTPFEDVRPVESSKGLAAEAWNWVTASWQHALLAGFGVACVLAVLLAVRGGRESTPSIGRSADDVCQETSQIPAPHWRRQTTDHRLPNRSPMVVDAAITRQLSEIVEADPEAAAAILRSWIGQAS